jgi:alkylation response protein AidB-like acyl-CoA dehydrogenase
VSDLARFRQETRRWLETQAPVEMRGTSTDITMAYGGGRRAQFRSDDQRRWFERMHERGWIAPTWPKEYGGGGLSPAEAAIVQQEVARLRLPAPLSGMGLTMIGPTLLEYGNEEQKREHLPKILSGEIRWCQGYSEPNAGSDLASLETSAVLTPDGTQYVINGQKIWTSGAQFADWIFMLVRTDRSAGRKQNGITFLLVDMAQEGVDVRPIQLINGGSMFCEVFFTDVRASVRNVVGRVNNGWTVGKALLGHERSGLGSPRAAANEERLSDMAKRYIGERDGRLDDNALRDRLAQLTMDQRAYQLTMQRSADARKAGQPPGTETSLFKLHGTELLQRRAELVLSILGPQALGWEGPGFNAAELAHVRGWLGSRATTIYGGTTEIQLNIIAKRVLELPD